MLNENVSCIELNKKLNILVIGFESGKVSIVNNNNFTIFNYRRQEKVILSLMLDPLKEFLVSSSADGSYVIFSLKKMMVVKVLKNQFDVSLLSQKINLIENIAVSSNGLLTALLSNNKVMIYTRYNYNVKYVIKLNKSIAKYFLKVKFIKNDQFICTLTSNNTIIFYNFITLRISSTIDISYFSINNLFISDDSIDLEIKNGIKYSLNFYLEA